MSNAADTVAVRAATSESGAGWMTRLGLEPARVLKFIIGVLLLPWCAGVASAFHGCFWGTGTQLRVAVVGWPILLQWFLGGAGIFAAVAILFWRPLFAYTFAHEAAHALATWLCLGRVTNFRAATNGGQVTTCKSNTLIRLAPYVFPLYVVLVAAIFVGCDWAGRPLNKPELLAALLGATLALHLGFTLCFLRIGQSDLKQDGWFFSLVLIFIGNALLVAAILGLALSGKAAGAWDSLCYVAGEGSRQGLRIWGNLIAAIQQALRS